jgi:tetratricopeptide (TPR) repeat protein
MYNFLFNELYDKALQFYQRKAYIVSLEYLNEAISLDLTISSIRLSKTFELRGLVRIQLKQYLASIIDLNKAINLDSKNPSLYYYRYLSHSVLSNYVDAIEDCKRLIILEPEDDNHRKNLKALEEISILNKKFNDLNG